MAITIFVAWSYHSEIDQIVRAQGEVVPSSSVQSIQTEFGGVLRELEVREGQLIEQGQTVVRLDPTLAEADYKDALARLRSRRARLERLESESMDFNAPFAPHQNAEIDSGANFYRTQEALFKKRTIALKEELDAIDGILEILGEEIQINLPLAQKGDVSRTEILRLQREEAELFARRSSVKNRYIEETQAELAEVEEEYERLLQLLVQKRRIYEQTNLVSPVRGIVTNLQSSTVGRVFRPGDLIMEIVPIEDDLLIEARVSTQDIGFLEIDQSVVVKVDAFDYTIHGDLNGKLIYISADSEEEDSPQGKSKFFKVKIRTVGKRFSKTDEPLRVLPGMTIVAEIKTGKTSILKYLLKPVIKTLDRSFTEI
ncbi:MAG: HlyD family efflux transporter periplasmic adaptor subunit [Betaproteobacteria bacterium]